MRPTTTQHPIKLPQINRSTERKVMRHRPRYRLSVPAWVALAVSVGCLPAAALADAPSEPATVSEDEPPRRILMLRPHGGVGWTSSYNRSGNGLAVFGGARLLFPAPLSPKVGASFGLEATYLELDATENDVFEERYVAVGVVLEMTVLGGFNLGIGTLGYVGVGGTDRNPFGVVTNLGWEPTWDARALPNITLRTEWIFDRATYNVLSLNVGVTFGL